MSWKDDQLAAPSVAQPSWQSDPEMDEKSMAGFAKNAGADVGNIFKAGMGISKKIADPLNLLESAQAGSIQPTKDYLSHEFQSLKGMPGAIYKDTKDLITHPIETAYQHPVNTALNVVGAVQGLGAIPKMMGTAGKTAGVAAEAGIGSELGSFADDFSRTAAEAPKPVELPGEAAKILNEIPRTPPPQAPPPPPNKGAASAAEQTVPMGSTFQETVANIGKKIPQEIKGPLEQAKQFAESKYGRIAQKPGIGDILGDAMIRKAQGMRFRELGGTPGQARVLARDIGEEGLRELMDVAKEKGITKSPIGYQRRQATKALKESSGRTIGGIREIATKRGAVHDTNSLVQNIKAKLDAEYLGKGTGSSEKGAYLKALEDIKANANTPEALAKKITEMNKKAVKNKMTQPTSAITDVANEASRLNNQLIKKHLSPKEMELYDNSLRDFGASRIFDKLQGFEVGREMGGRAGVGGVLRNLKQGAMDLGGGKIMENFYDRFGPRLKSNPQVTKNLASLSEGAIDDLLSALDDAIDEINVAPK